MRPKLHYFNTGHVAFPSVGVADAVREWIECVARVGSDAPAILDALEYGDLSGLGAVHSASQALIHSWEGLEKLYERLGTLADCPRDRIAISPTFMGSLLLTLRSLVPLGYNALFYTDLDHPNVVKGILAFAQALQISATEIRIADDLLRGGSIENAEEYLLRKVNGARRAILFLSHVDYRFGVRFDLQGVMNRLHYSNALVVDGAHSVGQFQLKINPSDNVTILLGSGHKWLGGWRSSAFACAYGTGAELNSIMNFWESQSQTAFSTFDRLSKKNRLIDWGSVCEIPLISLGVGMRLLAEFGVDHVETYVSKLRTKLTEGITQVTKLSIAIGEGSRNGVLFVRSPELSFEASEIAEILRGKYAISVSGYSVEVPGIRVCLSYHNTSEDIDVLLRALGEIAR